MKLQLDTTAKTVKVESDIKMSLLIKTLKSLLPDDWKDFTLQTHTTITQWTNPTIIREYPTYPQWWSYPWYNTHVTTFTNPTNGLVSGGIKSATNIVSKSTITSTKGQLNNGVYNVQI